MKNKYPKIIRKFAPFIVLVAGIGTAALVIKTGPKPEKKQAEERQYLVDAIKATPIDVTPRIKGYGEVEPDKIWKAISQVSGKIIWKAQKLESGEFFDDGELMLRIDDSEIKLSIQKARAEIKKYQAKIEELKSNRANMESRLAILKKVHEFNQKKLERQKKLYNSRAVASVTVEEEEINALTQESSIAELETNIKLIPAQIAYQEAELAAAKANLEQSELDLSYTKIKAPFNCRVSSVSVEKGQYVAVGENLFTADAIDLMEIPVQFSMDQLGLLLNPGGLKKLEKKGRPHEAWEITVSVNGGIKSYAWKGKFLRIASGIDTATRMLKMVIGVSDPYKKDKGSMKPPLDRGLFCSVEIKGRTARNLLVVPRYAIHEGRLYIANKDSRLEIRPVKTGFNIEQHTVIELGLKPGETVIVSDIVPAVSGMKLKVKMDQELMEKAKRELSGNGAKDD